MGRKSDVTKLYEELGVEHKTFPKETNHDLERDSLDNFLGIDRIRV